MGIRTNITIILLSLGVLLAFLPERGKINLKEKPETLSAFISGEKGQISADQLAKMIADDDTTMRIIDLRSAEEYSHESLPGAINIPFDVLTGRDPSTCLLSGKGRNIFCSDSSFIASYALVIAVAAGYENSLVLSGGMKEWYRTVMNSSFTGERITPRENALFEARSRAKRKFISYNSLPDSLRFNFLGNSAGAAKKLDGGCE